jgi:uncharacterized phage protein gp47/JayE
MAVIKYGVTNTGFVLKRLDDILAEMRSKAQTQLPGLDVSSDSVSGTMIDVAAAEIAEQWFLAEQVYNSRFPNTSEGIPLDNIGQINGIQRRGIIKSSVKEGFQGVNSTAIPQNTQVKSDAGDVYATVLPGVLDNTDTNSVEVQVLNVFNNYTYIIQISDNSVSYVSSGSATIQEITNGMIDEINLQTTALLVNAGVVDEDNGIFGITSNDGESSFEVTLTADFQLNKFWTPIQIQALEAGQIEAIAGTITTIITPLVGLESVNNFTDVLVGDNVQSDDDYRLRLFQEVRKLGGGSLEAIKSRILNNVNDVLAVKIFENHEMIEVAGRPPKSIELLVEGGLDSDIAEELWQSKGGGIETFGTVYFDIIDSQGDIRKMWFSRPVKAYVWFRVTLTTGPDFPVDGEELIKENIVRHGRTTFTIGDLLLIQSFYCPVYEIAGVITVLIEMQVTSDLTPPVSYETTNIQLDDNNAPLFDESRAEVIIS